MTDALGDVSFGLSGETLSIPVYLDDINIAFDSKLYSIVQFALLS